MKSSNLMANPIEELKKRVNKFNTVENPQVNTKKQFDYKRFLELAKEVKKTFKDEDIIRIQSGIQAK